MAEAKGIPNADRAPPHRQTVLVVDDEQDILDSLKVLFESAIQGIEVVVAPSGAKGLEALRRGSIDLIVSDYKMPGMDGLEFLAKARALAPTTPRVLVTAFPDLDLAIRAINEASIENFVTKPVEPDAVVGIVRSLLAERRSQELKSQAFARSLDLLRRQVQARQ